MGAVAESVLREKSNKLQISMSRSGNPYDIRVL